MSRRFQIVAVALAVGFTLSACGTEQGAAGVHAGTAASESPKDTKGKKMDMQEAAERADGMLDAVLKKIDPKVQWAHGPTTKGSCDVTRRRTVMTIVSADRRSRASWTRSSSSGARATTASRRRTTTRCSRRSTR